MRDSIKESFEVVAIAFIAIVCGWAGTIALDIWIFGMVIGAVVGVTFKLFKGWRKSIKHTKERKKDEKWARILKELE